MKTLRIFLLAGFSILGMVSCSMSRKTAVVSPQPKIINLTLTDDAQSDKYINLDYGIKLYIADERISKDILGKHDDFLSSKPVVTVNPNVKSFVSESMRGWMRTMGFNLDSDIETDYMLTVDINAFHVSYLAGIGWQGTVSLNINVRDKNRKMVYPNTNITGHFNQQGSGSSYILASDVLNKAYVKALKDIDWDRIAYFLDKSSQPSMEKNKRVTGDGNTALESTVIRWYVDSKPRGADVSWRVVSSTPDVKNTNQNYLGSTPYESTETFDIKGLTYNNSGNVQIEITCEKEGYVIQKKRVNLRQAIDQKEISTKFNLVAE